MSHEVTAPRAAGPSGRTASVTIIKVPTLFKRLSVWMSSEGVPLRLFWVGLFVRVASITIGHTFRVHPYFDHFDFAFEMGRTARALATGRGFADPFDGQTGPTAWTPPLYPLIIAGAFKLFGVYTALSAWVVLTINSIFSAATGAAVYEIARRSFAQHPKRTSIALWSGWLWALYPACLQYAVHWFWEMAVTAGLFSWVLVLTLRLRGVGSEPDEPTQTTTRWAAFGLLWGLIALSNSSLLSFLPFCGMWIIWPNLLGRKQLLLTAGNVLLASLCCIAVITPWDLRNEHVFHTFVPLRSNLGAELFLSMQEELQGFPWGPPVPIAFHSPELQLYKRMGEIAYTHRQGERAKALLRARPGLFVRFTLKRIFFFWAGVPHPVDLTWKSLLNELIRELNYSFASVAALLGLILALRQRIPGAWLFLWAFAVIPIVYYCITVQARFRSPIEPIMLILIVFLFQSAERHRSKPGSAVT